MERSTAKLELVYPHTAGIDIGSERHYVAVGQGKDHVRSFGCFTRDITEMASWLKSEGIVSVVMESTGCYWIPVYEILESHGFRVALVNASHVKNAPGRKSDVQDCQWLQKIYSVGLLRDSFIPTESIRRLRSYTRLKEDHIRRASSHIQHMHKAFDQMNIKFHQVLSETTGVSSMKVMKAIVAGERSASALLSLCTTRIKNQKESEILQSLEGNYRQEHIFALKQAIAGYEFYMQQVEECDREIETLLQELTATLESSSSDSRGGSSSNRSNALRPLKRIRRRDPGYNLEAQLERLTGGVNLSVLPGMTAYNSLQLLAEIGTDMSRWPTEKHFTSWLGISPGSHKSGKKKGESRTKRLGTSASTILRVAARNIGRSKTALGGFYRRISSIKDAPTAITATARKLAVQIYNLLKFKKEYHEYGSKEYEDRYNKLRFKNLEKKADKLGYKLVKV